VVVGSELAFSFENNCNYKATALKRDIKKKRVLFKVQPRKSPLGNPHGFMFRDNNFGKILFHVLFN